MNIKIEKWQGGRKGALAMRFDDGLESHIVNAIPQLSERNLKGTFYINPGAFWFNTKAWFSIADNPNIEFGNHSFSHKGAANSYEAEMEISKCSQFIENLRPYLKYPRLISFQYPGGFRWKVEENQKTAMLQKYHLIRRPPTQGKAAGIHLKTAKELISVAEHCLNNNTYSSITFHGVGTEWHSVNLYDFITLLDFLSNKKEALWVTDSISLHKYITELNNATISILTNTVDETIFNLNCPVENLYDEPLTVSLPTEKNTIILSISQNSKNINFRFSGDRVYFELLPNSSNISIKKISKIN